MSYVAGMSMHYTTAQPAMGATAHHYWPAAAGTPAATTQSVVSLPGHAGGQVPISYVTAAQATADYSPFALTTSMAAPVATTSPYVGAGVVTNHPLGSYVAATPRVLETPTVVESAPVTYTAPTVVESAPVTYAAPTTSYISPTTYAAPTTTYAAPTTTYAAPTTTSYVAPTTYAAAPLTTTTSMIALPSAPVAGYPSPRPVTTTTTTPAKTTPAKTTTTTKKTVKSAKPKTSKGCCH